MAAGNIQYRRRCSVVKRQFHAKLRDRDIAHNAGPANIQNVIVAIEPVVLKKGFVQFGKRRVITFCFVEIRSIVFFFQGIQNVLIVIDRPGLCF